MSPKPLDSWHFGPTFFNVEGLSCVSQNVQLHFWLQLTRCHQSCQEKQKSTDIAKYPLGGGWAGGGVQNCHWLRTTRLDRQEGTESFRLLHGLMVGSFTEMEQNGRGAIFVCVCLIGIGGLLKQGPHEVCGHVFIVHLKHQSRYQQ